MENREATEALRKLALGLGMTFLERLSANLDPEQLISEANAVLGSQLREVVLEILQDPDSPHLSSLTTRIYEEIDENNVIQTIAEPLANELVKWFKEEDGGGLDILVEGIVNRLDLDELNELASEKVANRMSLSSE